MARTVEEGTELFLEVLRHPTFPPDEVEKRRRELLIALSHRDDDPASRAIELFYATHFPHHPYGMTALGERESLTSLTRAPARRPTTSACSRRTASSSRRSATSTPRWLLDRLEAALGDLPPVRPLPRPLPTPPDGRIQRVTRHLDRQQTHFVLGMRGGRITDSDRAVLKTLEAILSRQGGRLFLELRDRQGLAYSVSAFASEGVDPGVFGIYFACAPDVVERAIAGVLAELARLRDVPVSADELGEARKYLLGSYEISLQTNSSQADELAFNEVYGLGIDGGDRYREALAHVTPAAVQAAARGYFTLDAYTLAIVGPQAARAKRASAVSARKPRQPGEALGVVAEDRVDAERDQPPHLARLVHRPHPDVEPARVRRLDDARVDPAPSRESGPRRSSSARAPSRAGRGSSIAEHAEPRPRRRRAHVADAPPDERTRTPPTRRRRSAATSAASFGSIDAEVARALDLDVQA